MRFALIGSTGNGKSSTAEYLTKSKTFVTGDKFGSCTKKVQVAVNKSNQNVVFDMPGFNDNIAKPEELVERFKQGGFAMYEFDKQSENLVDAFLLVQKANPRLTTIIPDVQAAIQNYGPKVLKSVIILVIQPEKKRSLEDFWSELKELRQLYAIYDSVDAQVVAMPWDNQKPYEGMDQMLEAAVAQVEPYTKRLFLKSQVDIQRGAVEQTNAYFVRQSENLGISYENVLKDVKSRGENLANQLEEEPPRGFSIPFFGRKRSVKDDIKAELEEHSKILKLDFEHAISKLQEEMDLTKKQLKEAHLRQLELLKSQQESQSAQKIRFGRINIGIFEFEAELIYSAIKSVAEYVWDKFALKKTLNE